MIKDETRNPPKKYLQLAESTDIRGPFGKLSAPFTPVGLWVEGPTIANAGNDYCSTSTPARQSIMVRCGRVI